MNANNFYSVLLLFFLLEFVATEQWTHHTVLDGSGKYHLYWKPPEDINGDSEIMFKVEVQANGFVGFGLSPTGGMAGADIVTGWVKDGKPYFQDRHGIGKTMPVKDEKQDWELVEAKENDTHTTLQFRRKLNTCDEKDMVIDDSTMRLIFAFSTRDPENENPFYHFKNRGSKSVMLLQMKAKPTVDLDDPSLLHWDIKSPNFEFSRYKTIYWCKIFKSPPLSKKHHILHIKPLIQEGNEQFVHHMVLYECVGATDDEYQDYIDYLGHECFHPNMPDAMQKCDGVTVAWAVGGEDLVFPEHVGMPLDPAPGKYYMLEIHYDNPQRARGITDKSGLRIYYTPNLRKFDAGCLMLGSTVTPRMFIPPEQKKYVVTGHSNPECLDPKMPEDGIKALGILMHSHLIGRGLTTRHFRGQTELSPLAEEKNYDFNYQEYRYYKEEVSILRGDQITVECTYDSNKKTEMTFGGISTQEEMCLAFVLYYPRLDDRYASLSIPTFSAINSVLHTNFTNMMSMYALRSYNWKTVNISEVENRLRYSDHDSHCYFGNGEKDMVKSLISYPKNLEPLVSEDKVCSEAGKNFKYAYAHNENTTDQITKNESTAKQISQSQKLIILICLICLIIFI